MTSKRSLGLALESAPPRLLQFDPTHLDIHDLSSSPSDSGSPVDSIPSFDPSDDIINDFAALEKLRQNVHQNLRLRPLRSSTTLLRNASPRSPHSLSRSSPAWFDPAHDDIASPTSSTASVYYTPTSDSPLGAYSGVTATSDLSFPYPNSPLPPPAPEPFPHSSLLAILSRSPRPLIIDTRPVNAFLLSHLQHSVDMTIPSLILKRCRKPGAGFQSIDALRQYITTDRGKQVWDDTMNGGHWDGNILIYDEEMDEKLKNSLQSTAWVLLHAVLPLLYNGTARYLQGGLSSARPDPELHHLFVSGDSNTPLDQRQFQTKKSGGLFQLDTLTASRSKQFPQIDQTTDSPQSSISSSKTPIRSRTIDIVDSHSPPPQSIAPPRQPNRRPSFPTLRKLDTHTLPRLSLKTQMSKSATVSSGPKMPWHGNPSPPNIIPPLSTSHPDLSNPPSIKSSFTPLPESSTNALLSVTPTPSQPSSPRTPHASIPSSPMTARPEENEPPSSEELFPIFTVSTILPGFLFLGPEVTSEEHVRQLKDLGVKRILNIAAECDDDQGLSLKTKFESYVKIPMRDTVEEENIRRGVREVCDILDDARLHSSATYIHCKAGKSRSVTAVIGYLIHANHWTLTRAYSFVLERRKGISPNIGFVSELMNFEEEELGGKSVGVVQVDLDHQGENGYSSHAGGTVNSGVGVGGGARRLANLRESLPPTFNLHSYPFGGPDDEGPWPDVGDSGQETEIRDASGRYRHARRAPVDEMTLQPKRRVSKAGLESSSFNEPDGGHWG